jgi:hypothetical protein
MEVDRKNEMLSLSRGNNAKSRQNGGFLHCGEAAYLAAAVDLLGSFSLMRAERPLRSRR